MCACKRRHEVPCSFFVLGRGLGHGPHAQRFGTRESRVEGSAVGLHSSTSHQTLCSQAMMLPRTDQTKQPTKAPK